MRVQLVSRFFNTRNGGIGVYSKNLLKGLLERGVEVDVVQSTKTSSLGFLYFTLFEMATKAIKDVDVYHALSPPEAIYLPKEKTVVTFHDLIPLKEEFKQFTSLTKYYVGYYWFLYSVKKAIKAEKIICTSEEIKKELINKFNVFPGKIRVIRLGISKDLKPKKKRNKEKFTVGTLSLLIPRKRIDILIREFKKVKDKDVELLIAGEGPMLNKLKELAKGDERIKFLGFIPEKELNDFYNSLDLFVFPSKLEGYGLPIVEAMRCKVPVITLEDSIIPFDVKSRTYVVKPNELHKVIEKREFDVDIESNYKFSKLHDWDKCVEETIEVYEDVYNYSKNRLFIDFERFITTSFAKEITY